MLTQHFRSNTSIIRGTWIDFLASDDLEYVAAHVSLGIFSKDALYLGELSPPMRDALWSTLDHTFHPFLYDHTVLPRWCRLFASSAVSLWQSRKHDDDERSGDDWRHMAQVLRVPTLRAVFIYAEHDALGALARSHEVNELTACIENRSAVPLFLMTRFHQCKDSNYLS